MPLAYVNIKCNDPRINSRPTFDEAIRFASIRAIYVDRKPATTIYIINGRSRIISEMGNGAPATSTMMITRIAAAHHCSRLRDRFIKTMNISLN